MNKDVWGPDVWKIIHTVTINLPVSPTLEDQKIVNNFIYSIGELIPCEECKKHFKSSIENFPPNTNSRELFFKWGVDIHNKVNERIGKKIINYAEAKKIYENIYNMKINFNSKNEFNSNNKNILIYNLILISLILIFLYLYFKK
jgi:hypothetical protein